MEAPWAFIIAFGFSFVGTVPPGSINLSIIQLGLDHKISTAWRLALAASIIEYPYAWLAIEFETVITSSTNITENFQLVTGIVMIGLGALSLITSNKPSSFATKFNESGFRRGIVLALLNPQALVYWVAITAYVKSQRWTDLSTQAEIHAYLFGVSLGGLALLMIFAYLAKQVVKYFQGNTIFKRIPGFTLLALGIYAIVEYFF
jgi:threonine/homoserine/homoserine lactone efflux protein